jgi:hypothetical protein
MRNSLSRQRGRPLWKPSGRPLATPAMPPAKLGSEKADRVISGKVDGRWPTYGVEVTVMIRAHPLKQVSMITA